MPEIGELIGDVLWFFLPAFAANSAPVIAAYFHWFPNLAVPLDKGYIWRGKPLLGTNKTVRGLVMGVLAGALVGLVQYRVEVAEIVQSSLTIPSSNLEALAWGSLVGFGALLGDALKSFFKRRLNIPAGASWKPWDQIDIVVGVVLATWCLAPLTLLHILVAIALIGIGMAITSELGVLLGIKKTL